MVLIISRLWDEWLVFSADALLHSGPIRQLAPCTLSGSPTSRGGLAPDTRPIAYANT